MTLAAGCKELFLYCMPNRIRTRETHSVVFQYLLCSMSGHKPKLLLSTPVHRSLTHDLRSKTTDEGYRPEVIVLLPLLKSPRLEIFGGVLYKSDLYG
jgi:hypothetical protein